MSKSNKKQVEGVDLCGFDEVSLFWEKNVERPMGVSDEQRKVLSPMQVSILQLCNGYLLNDDMVELAGKLLTIDPKRILELLEQMCAHTQEDESLRDMFQKDDRLLMLDLKQFLLSGVLNRPEE